MRGTSVVHSEIHFEDSHITFELASTITADDVGKAVAIDTSGNTKAKLVSVAEEHVIGRLETFEDRTNAEGKKVGTVALRLIGWLPYAGTAPTVGQSVAGSTTAGKVKVAASQDPSKNYVVAVDATNGLALVHKI